MVCHDANESISNQIKDPSVIRLSFISLFAERPGSNKSNVFPRTYRSPKILTYRFDYPNLEPHFPEPLGLPGSLEPKNKRIRIEETNRKTFVDY